MENSSSSQLKPLSCIPCAKRKVRCDRAFPCQHCKRRKGDVCTYPVPKTGHQWSPPTPVRSDEAATPTDPFSSSSSRGTKRSRDTSIHDNDPTYRSIQADPAYRSIQAGLVEHDDQSNYIEAPVWYSWSEARTLANEKSVQLPIANGLDGYHGTLLDVSSPINAEPRFCHPSSEHIDILWRAFLDNVHPLVMVFFNWAKEPILRHAARDPAGLSSSEHAFCFSIYAMATLSMTEQECEAIFVERSKSSMLDKYQSALETALVVNNYASTSNILVLQALVLYLIFMRNRATSSTLFSLLGIIVRIAQRLGLHRDGSQLNLAPIVAEERRRVWWQIQHMEISTSQLLGTISMTLYASWDVHLPANLDDSDINATMTSLPPSRTGLTSMSHCMWRYYILYLHRSARESGPSQSTWITTSPAAPIDQKAALFEKYRSALADKFLQYCELLNPFHVLIQISIQIFLLAMQRVGHQPSITGTRISDMTQENRDELLKVCVKAMEYYLLGETTSSLTHFRWHHENYMAWTALVYILIEAYHRAATSEAEGLWRIVDRVCEVHPKLTTARHWPEVQAVARLVVQPWRRREERAVNGAGDFGEPSCVGVMKRMLNEKSSYADQGGEQVATEEMVELGEFDFDLIDWSAWEGGGM